MQESGTSMMSGAAEQTISVIVCVYNQREYLPGAMRDVLAQDHRDIEVILVDDGSTDGSGELCCAFADADPRVQPIHQRHAGTSVARNAGVAAATGAWVAFVDADDAIGPSYLRTLLDVATSQGVDVAIAQVECFDHDQEPPALLRADAVTVQLISGREACRNMYSTAGFLLDALWGKIYRRALFDTLRFPVGKTAEDAFVTHELLWPQERIALCLGCFYGYRNNPAGTVSTRSVVRGFDSIDALQSRVAYYERVGDDELADETRRLLAWWQARLCAEALLRGEAAEVPGRWRMEFVEMLDVLADHAHEPQANRLLGELLAFVRAGKG